MAPIRVLIVDDSALGRALLAEIVNGQPDMRAVGAAPDPAAARELIGRLDPDVLTLDAGMPRADGLEFLDRLMRQRPIPVVMVSSLAQRDAEATLRALELGAVDFAARPRLALAGGLRDGADELAAKIRAAARAQVKRGPAHRAAAAGAPFAARPPRPAADRAETLIFVGASTGGTEAIRELLLGFPAHCPGTLITQHMPPGFTRSFAARLDALCRIRVKEAQAGERVLPGHAYVAPGGQHLLVTRDGPHYAVGLSDGPPVNRHCPSVDVLFRSAAECAGANAIGVMLTGMGKDGAQAMRGMRDAGAYTVAQDEASCVVFGMPREAIAQGGVDAVLPLGEIAAQLFARLAGVRA